MIYSEHLRGWDLLGYPLLALIPYVIPFLVFIIGYVTFTKTSKKFAEIL